MRFKNEKFTGVYLLLRWKYIMWNSTPYIVSCSVRPDRWCTRIHAPDMSESFVIPNEKCWRRPGYRYKLLNVFRTVSQRGRVFLLRGHLARLYIIIVVGGVDRYITYRRGPIHCGVVCTLWSACVTYCFVPFFFFHMNFSCDHRRITYIFNFL